MTAFAGFGPGFAAFFSELAERQDRAWFRANKGAYEDEVLAPLRALLMDLNDRLRTAGVPLSADPKRSIPRIHRDVRFSKDKSPYKTHASATLTRVPGEMSAGLAYVHIDPQAPFVGAGCHALEPAELAAFRQASAKPSPTTRTDGSLSSAGSTRPGTRSTARTRSSAAPGAASICPMGRLPTRLGCDTSRPSSAWSRVTSRPPTWSTVS